MKQCKLCLETKGLEDFYKNVQSRDGYRAACITCEKKRWGRESRGTPRGVRYQEPSEKLCRRCGRVLAIENFAIRRSRRVGRYSRCRECQSELHREWRSKNPDSSRYRNLKAKYGITGEQYLSILEAQGDKCGICGAKDEARGFALSVDHDHDTGEIRGVLCRTCNSGIGSLGDSVEGLKRAIKYLEESRTGIFVR